MAVVVLWLGLSFMNVRLSFWLNEVRLREVCFSVKTENEQVRRYKFWELCLILALVWVASLMLMGLMFMDVSSNFSQCDVNLRCHPANGKECAKKIDSLTTETGDGSSLANQGPATRIMCLREAAIGTFIWSVLAVLFSISIWDGDSRQSTADGQSN